MPGGTKERSLRTMGRLARVQLNPPARQKYFPLLAVADLIFPGLGDNVVLSEFQDF